jgi:hypothetical protein
VIRTNASQLRLGTPLALANELGFMVRAYGGTDKWIHDYTPHYEQHLARRRFRRQVVFEIGVGGYSDIRPGGSLAIWRDYFVRSTIVGLDISPKQIDLGARVKFERVDQSSSLDLQRVIEQHGCPDVVIDDGSHVGNDLTASFDFLWPRLQHGGVYIIEDLSTSYYPKYGGGDPPPQTSAVALVQRLVDCVQAQDSTFARKPAWGSRSAPQYFDVCAVHVHPGIVFIEKADAPD